MTNEEVQLRCLDEILITEELSRRVPRTTDLNEENHALHTLVGQVVEQPQIMLKKLVTIATQLCRAETAGVSLLEVTPSGEDICRWLAVAGMLEAYEQTPTLYTFSSCGICLERQAHCFIPILNGILAICNSLSQQSLSAWWFLY
jgi:hypothetical protein